MLERSQICSSRSQNFQIICVRQCTLAAQIIIPFDRRSCSEVAGPRPSYGPPRPNIATEPMYRLVGTLHSRLSNPRTLERLRWEGALI